MTYAQSETSEYGGHPIELFTFTRQGNVWRYTSADEDKNISGFVFSAYPIKSAVIEQTQQMARSPMTLTLSKQVPFLNQFRGSPPTSVTTLMIQKYHDGVADYQTVWLGRVTNVRFSERQAEVRCEPVFTSLKRPALRRRYQSTCPHVLYGATCGVNKSSYAVPATLSANGGTVLSSATFALYADNYFSGGYVDWDTGSGNLERRFIIGHVADDISLNLPFNDMPGNANIVAYPGCDHLLTTCNTKFANEDNYGGQPFYPGKNPFGGSPVF